MVHKKMMGLMVMTMLLFFTGSFVSAATIKFVPLSQAVGPGSSATVDVVIFGLGSGVAPSLGAFDLDISFDPAVVSFLGASFGPFLGFSIQGGSGATVTSPLNIGEISLESIAALDALQPSSFTLATLNFGSLAFGTSPLAFGPVRVISDAFGNDITSTVSFQTGSITVTPAPPILLLMGSGFAALALCRRMKR